MAPQHGIYADLVGWTPARQGSWFEGVHAAARETAPVVQRVGTIGKAVRVMSRAAS